MAAADGVVPPLDPDAALILGPVKTASDTFLLVQSEEAAVIIAVEGAGAFHFGQQRLRGGGGRSLGN